MKGAILHLLCRPGIGCLTVFGELLCLPESGLVGGEICRVHTSGSRSRVGTSLAAETDGRGALAKKRLSTDCSGTLCFQQTEFASRSSQWFIASRLGRVEMLKAGCTVENPAQSVENKLRTATGRFPIGRRLPTGCQPAPQYFGGLSSHLVGRRPMRTARFGCPT